MDFKQNLHIHTTYADGRDTPQQIIHTAIEKGFHSIGFSEHSYMPFSSYPLQMTPEKTVDYIKEIRALKEKYKGETDIFCGLELELFSELDTSEFDYVIGSVHYLDFDGEILGFDRSLDEAVAYVRDNFGGDGLAFAKKYYETLCSLEKKGRVDILGHFDLLTKNNEKGKFIDVTSKEYLYYGYEAIHALKGKVPFFEVNTGAISRGYRTLPYPQREFLSEFKRCGYGAVITSDCHDRNHLDCGYDMARELLLSNGFCSIFILTDNGFREVGL